MYLFYFCITIQFYCILIIIRGNRVAKFRYLVIAAIGSVEDIKKRESLWAIYDQVTFQDMVFEWWKPLKNFYPKEITKLIN